MLLREDPFKTKPVIDIRELYRRGCLRQPREQMRTSLGSIKIALLQDPHHLDWYIELLSPPIGCISTTINLEQTHCHYGGVKEWLVCPSCTKRVTSLYQEKSEFWCRKCIGMTYFSQKIPYRSMQYVLWQMTKAKEMRTTLFKKMHPSISRKKLGKYMKLTEKIHMNIAQYGNKNLAK